MHLLLSPSKHYYLGLWVHSNKQLAQTFSSFQLHIFRMHLDENKKEVLIVSFLTLCPLGNFACFFFRLLSVFLLKSAVSKISFRIIITVSNSLYPDQARPFVGPGMGQNCLQRWSANDTLRQRVKWHKTVFGAFRFFQTRLNVNVIMAFRVACECCVFSFAPERVYRHVRLILTEKRYISPVLA